MLIRRPADIAASEITDERLYLNRREFLCLAAGAVAAAACSGGEAAQAGLPNIKTYPPGPFHTDEERNPFEDITTYNNFYEFGSAKSDPSQNSGRFRPAPWTVKVDGHVAKPAEYQLEDLIRPHQLEERVYRLRCVEAWSMVIPWVGIPLADVIKRFEPTSKAKFVEFTTILRPAEMPGQRTDILEWPYMEGLRMDEALHPLAILAVGLYGKTLLNQNGAPIRLVVPWKYGFKSIKSIVRMRFVERQPPTAWSRQAPQEYGFYSNVNPEVDHPRWSQKTERRLGEFRRRKTLMFNGYADQVASLYAGMNLRTNY